MVNQHSAGSPWLRCNKLVPYCLDFSCELLNNFVKENSAKSKLKFLGDLAQSWHPWKALNEWDFLDVFYNFKPMI
jgi:hypothetical protein